VGMSQFGSKKNRHALSMDAKGVINPPGRPTPFASMLRACHPT
jgi:hypothetical protein